MSHFRRLCFLSSVLALAPCAVGVAPPEEDVDVSVAELGEVTNDVGMRFKRIPRGTFRMGADRDDKDAYEGARPAHAVEISEDFYLGVHEVTQGQFRAVMGFNPSHFSHDGTKTDKGTYYNFSLPRGGSDKVKGFTQ